MATALPAPIQAAIAAGGVVRIPSGTYAPYTIPQPASGWLVIVGGPLTFEADLSEMTGTSQWYGLKIESDFKTTTYTKGQQHVTGRVRKSSRRLRWADSGPMPFVGERVFLHLGVDQGDPNEPEYGRFATVSAVRGREYVEFEEPLDCEPTVYDSLAAFDAVVYNNQNDKVGLWGANGGNARGIGLDHGLTRFVGGRPRTDIRFDCDVTIQTTGVNSESDYLLGPNGAKSLWVGYGERIYLPEVTVNTSPGSATHWHHVHGGGVGKLIVTGRCFERIDASTVNASSAINLWGSKDIQIGRVDVNAKNCGLLNSEIHPEDVHIGPSRVRGEIEFPFTPFKGPTLINVYGALLGTSRVGPVVCQWDDDWQMRGSFLESYIPIRGLSLDTPGFHIDYGNNTLMESTGPVVVDVDSVT